MPPCHRQKKTRQTASFFCGAPAETRTPDTLIKSQVLYHLSYRGAYVFLGASFGASLSYHTILGLSSIFPQKIQVAAK